MKLSLPKIAERPDPSIETRAVYIEEWIDGLAYANPPRLLEQVLDSVRGLNGQPMKTALRAQLLELHVKPFQFALQFRREQRPALTSVALDRQRRVSRQLRKVAVAMALGYKQALSERATRKGRLSAPREQRQLLQRATLFTGLALLACYDAYRPVPEGLWRELVALYLFAAREDVSASPVSAAVSDELFARSCGHLFKRFCLTCIVDPYQLAYGELWQVFAAFGELADETRVLSEPDDSHLGGQFVIDPASDEPPKPLAHGGERRRDEGSRVLDANPALALLQAQRRASAPGSALAPHVLAAMVRALGLPARRHTPREAAEGRAVVAVGLAAIHHFLHGRAGAGPHSAGDEDEHDIEVRSPDEAGVEFAASYSTESWQMIDEGPGGVGIRHDGVPASPVKVGELLGLQFPLRGDAPDDWTLAVVRRLVIEPVGDHRAGVQILADRVAPLLAYLESAHDTATNIPHPVLVTPDLTDDPSASLIVSRGLLRPGSQLRLTGDGDAGHPVTLRACLESTASFDRFSFAVG